MKIFIAIYLIIGGIVNIYYHVKNAEKYAKAYYNGEIGLINFIIGGFLTIFLWPISIFNNEKSDK